MHEIDMAILSRSGGGYPHFFRSLLCVALRSHVRPLTHTNKSHTTHHTSQVKEFCGHGIGRVFHEAPNVLHYKNNQRLGVMAPGHVFTIEPMICMVSLCLGLSLGLISKGIFLYAVAVLYHVKCFIR